MDAGEETSKVESRRKDSFSGRQGFKRALGLERNVAVMSLAVFLLGAGEELWARFMPKYLEALGAGVAVIGLFGTARDFLDAIYQYPGGYISDRIGNRRALVLFSALAASGYVIYAFSASWHFIFVGLIFVMAWSSMASPAIFATIAEQLPRDRRAMGFTVQSILKRVPVLISPTIGGLLIACFGLVQGIRISLLITTALAALAIFAQQRLYLARPLSSDVEGIKIPFSSVPSTARMKLFAQLGAMHPALKRLLISDIIVRTCEGMAGVFIVLYAMNVTGMTSFEFGVLMAVQMATSITVYIPAAWLADRYGRKPFVIATFICFALFPLAVALSKSFWTLALAFVIGGLRETGEPARKAIIVDLADPNRRGRTVGLYYLTRSLAITPAALTGGLLWNIDPTIPFFAACLIGLVGAAVFTLTVDRRYAA
ncbi:MAG: MFS transporter [Blastocatellia bacterium]|nr:MFS transporter [Blastocatellia bacterium]